MIKATSNNFQHLILSQVRAKLKIPKKERHSELLDVFLIDENVFNHLYLKTTTKKDIFLKRKQAFDKSQKPFNLSVYVPEV